MNSMIYFDLFNLYSLLRKQHVKCGPVADRLSCRISTKMASQPCGGTIPNKPPQCVYSQLEFTLFTARSEYNYKSRDTDSIGVSVLTFLKSTNCVMSVPSVLVKLRSTVSSVVLAVMVWRSTSFPLFITFTTNWPVTTVLTVRSHPASKKFITIMILRVCGGQLIMCLSVVNNIILIHLLI